MLKRMKTMASIPDSIPGGSVSTPSIENIPSASIILPAERVIPGRLNALIVTLQIFVAFTCIVFAAKAATFWQLILIACIFSLLMQGVYGSIHEAVHGILFSNPKANDRTGTLLTMFFPIPFHLLRQGHLNHHRRNRSDDEAFDLWFPDEYVPWKWVQWFGIITGGFYVICVIGNFAVLLAPFLLHARWFKFDRPSQAFMNSLNPRYAWAIRLEALAILAFHPAIIWLLNIPILHYFALFAAFGILWSAMQYVHHYDTPRHITQGARNLFVWAPIDKLWLNHNWHKAHHEHPTVSWLYLEEIGKRSGDPPGFLPFAYIRMWAGPRAATQHVETQFAGRIWRGPKSEADKQP